MPKHGCVTALPIGFPAKNKHQSIEEIFEILRISTKAYGEKRRTRNWGPR
jgi:hypothetical protein